MVSNFGAAVFGAAFGFGAVCFKNAIQRLAWYRKPWEHMIAVPLGAGVWWAQYEWVDAKVGEIKALHDREAAAAAAGSGK